MFSSWFTENNHTHSNLLWKLFLIFIWWRTSHWTLKKKTAREIILLCSRWTNSQMNFCILNTEYDFLLRQYHLVCYVCMRIWVKYDTPEGGWTFINDKIQFNRGLNGNFLHFSQKLVSPSPFSLSIISTGLKWCFINVW